jgi:hypothetical protein
MMSVFATFMVSGQEVRVGPNTGITVKAGATMDISGGNLLLASDATGDASLIDDGSITYSGGGQTIVQRYLTEGQWHLVSSPVDNLVSGAFTADYLQFHSETSNGWTDIASENYNLGIMQGYALWSVEAGPTTEVFSGTTNTGVYNKAFTQSGDGWNLMGNPYPSALDWDAVSLPPELNGAFWLFDPTIGANGDYAYYINGGGVANTTNQFIPSGQGFFVRATGGSGTLTFDNSDRVHNDKAFYKSTETELLVLQVTGNNITTQTAIRFDENATQGADRLYDVYKIISDSPDVPILFSKAGDENLAINTLPNIEGNKIVPVWFRAGMSGKYTINATEIETFNNQTPIYIEDLQAGTIQNLRIMPEYVFNYNNGNDKSFLIYFTEPEKNNRLDEVNIFTYGDGLQINFPVDKLLNPNFEAQIFVFDIMGRKVMETSTTEINNQFSFKGNSNIYMVSVISEGDVVNAKVFIK